MYNTAKKLLTKIIPVRLLQKYEPALRSVYAVFYSGKNQECTVCGKKLRTFLRLHNNDLLCPKCGSLSRDRRLWLLINNGFLAPGATVLDFSPSRSLARKMKKLEGIHYLSTDLSGNFIAHYRFDITKITLPSNTAHNIICYHVLEHIDNDRAAMAELHRVLKPGGRALIQTPFKDGDIYENPEITTPQGRLEHFGQDDHVRVYSVAGLKQRLENAGFTVEAKTFGADVFYGLTGGETVMLVTKP
jgi:SAM-dependent methyltransferase